MPAISGPFGPIVEPGWIGGAEMPGQSDLVKAYTNAWQINASINSKAAAMENQAMHYALMADEARKNNALREQQFSLSQQRSDLAHEDRIRGFQVAQDRNDRIAEDKERDDKWRERKWNDQLDAKQRQVDAKNALDAADTTLAAEGLFPGMKGYDDRYHQLTDGLMGQLPTNTFNADRKLRFDAHQQVAVQKWNQFHQMEKSFELDKSDTLYNGALGGGNNPFLYPNTLKPETESAGWYHPFTPAKPTGKLLVPQPDGSTIPVDTRQITRLGNAWQQLQAMKQGLPSTEHNPDAGIYDVGQEPAPLDPSQREENKVYKLPKGQFRWVNGQWVNP